MRRHLSLVLGLVLLGAAAVPLAAQVPDSVLIRRALGLHRAVPMMDGHNDLPWKIRTNGHDDFTPTSLTRGIFEFDSLDISRAQPSLMTDIPRMRAGGVGAQFWSNYVPNEYVAHDAARVTLEQMDLTHRLAERYPRDFVFARTAADIVRAHQQGRIASLIGIEGGHAIENSLGVLRMFYDAGARYMTLTHNTTLAWVDASQDVQVHNGLTAFGREVVREMNRLGMLVDLSHTSDSVTVQALRISEAPVIFSHSSARAIADHVRNLSDDLLRMVPANGGVVLVNFNCGFVSRAMAVRANARHAAVQEFRGRFLAANDTAGYRAALVAWDAANPQPPRPTLSDVADHIDHIRQVAGIDHVGYGSDFDGIDCAPQGLEDVSRFPALTAELLRRGYSDDDVKKVIGLNLLRVMRQAEAAARRLQQERGPSTATLYDLDSAVVRP
jgi:membrane dipeptidase